MNNTLLPLSASERKIAPAGRTMLDGTHAYWSKNFGTMKPAAINGFCNSARQYLARVEAANGAPAAAKTTPRKAAKPATASRRTRTAGATA
jgi:hypothetical protein